MFFKFDDWQDAEGVGEYDVGTGRLDLPDEEDGHCCDLCPAVHICFEVMVGITDEFFLTTYGLQTEVVWPQPGLEGGGVLRAFERFNHCSQAYEGLMNIAHFDSIPDFVRLVTEAFCGDDPFDAKMNYDLEPLEQVSETV